MVPVPALTTRKKYVMQIEKIKRFELVELTISSNNPGRFTFTTQPELRNQPDQIIIVKGISVYPVTLYSNSQVNGAVAGVANTEIPKAALVLYVNGEESIKLIPLAQLIHTQTTGATSLFQQEIQQFGDLENVSWDKSYVQFSVAPAGSPYIIPFGIEYLRMIRDPANPARWIDA